MTIQRRQILSMLAAAPAAAALGGASQAQMLPPPTGLPAGSVAPVGDNVVSYIEVAPGKGREALGILRALRDASMKEAGFKSFGIFQRVNSPHHFGVLELWADNAAREAHLVTAHVKMAREKLTAIETAPYDERPHRPLATGPARAAAAGALTCITHVDFVPVYREEGERMLRMLADGSRAEKGAARYDVLTQASRPNHMTIVETWDSEGALRAHATAKHLKDFRLSLLPRTGSLYDERIYRAVA
jgi:quinol monooxygenase YgiN